MAMPSPRALLSCLFVLGVLPAQDPPRKMEPPTPAAQAAPAMAPPEAPRGDDVWARKRAMVERRGGEAGEAYLLGKNRILEVEALKWKERAPLRLPVGVAPPALPGGTWTNLGPGSFNSGAYSPSAIDLNSGRPTAIVTHPTNPQILYLASSGGGVWKSTNADPAAAGDWTWVPVTDTIPASGSDGNVPIGHLAMDPSDPNTLYAGLGDIHGAGNAVGFWITHDGGSTWTKGWTNTPGPKSSTTQVLPLGAGVVLVASRPGLYRSTNGGATFAAVGPTAADPNFYVHGIVAFSATELALGGVTYDWGIPGWVTKWMYSADGGASWSDSSLDATLTSLPLDPWAAGLAGGQAGDGVAYATVGNKTTGKIAQGVARTADKGHIWTFRASGQAFSQSSDGGQSGYNMFIAVDPANSNHVFIGANLGSYRSLDGGGSWTPMTNWVGNGAVYAHADWHVGGWSKTGTKTLYVGNDGGLAVVRDPLRATLPSGGGSVPSDRSFLDNTRNKGLANHLLYTVASTTATNVAGARNFILAGMQDNSTGMRIAAGSDFLLSPPTGDGMGVLIHATDASKAVATSYYASIDYATNFGGASPTWRGSTGVPYSTDQFFTPIRQIPTDPNGVLTATGTTVYKSADFGANFTALGTTGLSGSLRRPAASYASASTFAVSASTSGNSATGFVTQNGGGSWTQFGTLPGASSIWDVDFSPSDPNVLYAVTQNYDLTKAHVYRSANLGASWAALDSASNGYPFGIPANVIRESRTRPNTLYVGTDIGVYASDNGGTTWSRLGTGQPYVRVDDLYEAPDGSFLRSATYGRGVWEIAFSGGAPVAVQPSSIPAATAWVSYSQAFTATGGTPPYSFALAAGSLPAGMTLSAAGLLSGTPTATGSFPITIQATDSATPTPGVGSRAYTLTVQAPVISINPNPLPAARISVAYSQTLVAGGGTAPYTLALISGSLPPGLGFNAATGLLSGTPTTIGTFTFTVRATDAHGFTGALVSNLAVLAPTITLAPGTLPAGQLNQSYSSTLTATGGTAPYTFLVNAGSLPPGLTLSVSGLLAGAPTTTGSFNFTIQAKDANNYTGSQAFNLSITGPPLVLGPGSLADGTAFQAYSVAFTASGGTAPYRFNLTAGNLPSGLSLDYGSGLLSGTPTAVGSSTFTIRATDAVGSLGSLNCVLRILAPAITLTPASLSALNLGATVQVDFSASGGQAPYGFAVGAGALPPGLILSAGGRLSGTAGSAGSFAFTITATDRNGFTGSQAYALTVGDQAPVITQPPADRSVRVGEPASFTVTATGTAPLAYQWMRNGATLAGATAAILNLATTTPADDGASFTVSVSNAAGSATSPAAVLHAGPVTITASVAQAGLLPGRPATYSATVGGAVDGSVSWSASGGTLVPSGASATFSASAAGSYTLTAAAVADPSRRAQVTILVHGADYTTPGRVTGPDALKLIGKLGAADPAIDLNGDGLVDAADLDLLLTLLGW